MKNFTKTSKVVAVIGAGILLWGTLFQSICHAQNPTASSKVKKNAGKAALEIPAKVLKRLDGQKQPVAPPADGKNIDFWIYAWEQFLNLNLKAEDGKRGVPAPGTTLNDMVGSRVWETWMTDVDLFLPFANEPPAWNNPKGISIIKSLTQHSKMHGDLVRPTAINEAVGGGLLDQNCNYVRFEVSINEPMYNRIRNKGWYNAVTQLAEPNVEFPNDSIELKAAWKILNIKGETPQDPAMVGHDANCEPSGQFDDPRRYLTAKAKVYASFNEETGQSSPKDGVEVTVGLVGLHLVTRTEGLPQRIWTTFEQVDNVKILPPLKGVDHKAKPPLTPSFFNPTKKNEGDYRHNLRIAYQSDPQNPVPVQVQRSIPIGNLNGGEKSDLPQLNEMVRTLLAKSFPDAPWQYYQLIGVQWPARPKIDPNKTGRDGSPGLAILGNTVIETFNQSRSSCIGCHSFARPVNKFNLSDFSWLVGNANSPKVTQPDKPSADQLFAYMTQFVPYEPNPTTNQPPAGPLYKTWGSFPNSKWNTYSGVMEGENPHGNWTRIYLNDIARKFANKWARKPFKATKKNPTPPPFPPGSIVLKENHKTWAADELVELTAMLKREEGYNPSGGDWYWLKVAPNGVVDRSGKPNGCISCHAAPPAGDFMLTWNYGREPWIRNYPAESPLPILKNLRPPAKVKK